MSPATVRALEACREAAREQALFYRALAVLAEDREEAQLAQRFHDLHADEQHHLSRLTARLLEEGHHPAALDELRAPKASLDGWEPLARSREEEEVRRYQALLAGELDPATRALVEEILEIERAHARELEGKWTMA